MFNGRIRGMMTPNFFLKRRSKALKWRKKALKYKIKALRCLLRAKAEVDYKQGKDN